MMEHLIGKYKEILSQVDLEKFERQKDKYSGVFLPVPFEEYYQGDKKNHAYRP